MSGNNYHLIKNLVNDMILLKPEFFKNFNYSGLRDDSIQGALEQYVSLKYNSDLNNKEKDLCLISVVAYLTLENALLRIKNKKEKNPDDY